MSGLNKDSSVPQPCVTGCGYNGTAENKSMCSKCYHEHQRQEQNRVIPVDAENRNKEPVSWFGKETATPAPVTVKRKAVEVEGEEVPKPKVQKNINRCFFCRKKIGLSNFKCRCGYHYCVEHQYSDSHNCSFDYKTFNKAILSKENPIIKAAKVTKI
eukprot:Plantae.Rhodophyta-Purpureofilum_apyrenoidigerum.ctg3038.p1 GENE.Plantae.Rhodophyta-Purpureofilum_apyrenoidigerum.ctg3038~~Plantae.Rhodophyta-Purpureofilum_apyrenoidigerum.ctg3038.p1  ORF type:complete len:157 (+),score=22.07 Plantae.Rhodophyta-Purpureofilum_apyrenoidigerum.ctg3038:171-641(+)